MVNSFVPNSSFLFHLKTCFCRKKIYDHVYTSHLQVILQRFWYCYTHEMKIRTDFGKQQIALFRYANQNG